MKRLFFTALAFVVLPLAAVAQGSVVREGTIESAILGATKEYSIYLPAGYGDSGRDYPVLYLLHGASDTHRAWPAKGNMKFIADKAISEGFALPMIIVMPDGRGESENNMGNNMGYFDQPGWAWEKHFFEEFIPYIEKEYRAKTDKASRAVSGLSMGGGGTTVFGLRYPEMFSSACPLSGLVGGFRSRGDNLSGLWKLAAQNAPTDIIDSATDEQLKAMSLVRWYIDCGDDDFLFEGNIELYLKMKEKNIPAQLRIRDGGHNWEYWQQSLPEVLKFISIGFVQ